jgi:hypothetical protein
MFANITLPRLALVLALAIAPVYAGCALLQGIAALRSVEFDLDRVSNAHLAGVSLDRVQSVNQLSSTDLARVAAALVRGELPFEFTLHVGAENPEENRVEARLVDFDWTLFLENRETISGTFDQRVLMPPGQRVDIPIEMRLDLLQFFDRGATDAIELALNLIGAGGRPKQIAVEAVPTIQTPLGPIRYPRPITIVDREVGR